MIASIPTHRLTVGMHDGYDEDDDDDDDENVLYLHR